MAASSPALFWNCDQWCTQIGGAQDGMPLLALFITPLQRKKAGHLSPKSGPGLNKLHICFDSSVLSKTNLYPLARCSDLPCCSAGRLGPRIRDPRVLNNATCGLNNATCGVQSADTVVQSL